MKLFNREKHEVYKNLAEGIVNATIRNSDFILFKIRDLEINTAPLVLEYAADYFSKQYMLEHAYSIYKRVNPKKASILLNVFSENYKNYLIDYDETGIELQLDEIMLKYEKSKNPEIPFIPPLMM